MIRLMKHYVTNGEYKAHVWYSRGTLIDGRDCVTLYAKYYVNYLGRIFAGDPNYQNDTDLTTDYHDKGFVRIFPDSPLWADACARAVR